MSNNYDECIREQRAAIDRLNAAVERLRADPSAENEAEQQAAAAAYIEADHRVRAAELLDSTGGR